MMYFLLKIKKLTPLAEHAYTIIQRMLHFPALFSRHLLSNAQDACMLRTEIQRWLEQGIDSDAPERARLSRQ